jgi:hypothetical protein
MTDGLPHDLVPVARIFSRPEMICFVSALEAEGVHVCVGADNHGRAQLLIVALGGYLVRVPATQLDQVVVLIEELRVSTELAPVPENLVWGVRTLFGMGVFFNFVFAWLMMPAVGVWALTYVFAVFATPLPMTMPGDYLNRRGKLVQMR